MRLTDALGLARARVGRWRPVEGRLPHVTGDNGRWRYLSPLATEREALTGLPWTGGFAPGQLWLAGRLGDARAATELLAPRAAQATTHDLGFLFWPSAVLGHVATGEEGFRELGLQAAASLVERALPSGVIQVIGALDDPDWRGRTIVDTWPNLMLLWWAERQGVEVAGKAARTHLVATLEALLRPDGSTFHAARFDDQGRLIDRGTVNGLGRDSTWARGQAWAVHGLVTAARATGDGGLQAAAELAGRWFLAHLPADRIPPWDFDAPANDPRDASAAAIVASALLDLGWEAEAGELLDALVDKCFGTGDSDGLLLHCCYRRPFGVGLDCATVWGDFFVLDALLHAVEPESRLDPLG